MSFYEKKKALSPTEGCEFGVIARQRVDVDFAFSNAITAIAAIASEKAMNVATRAWCGCNVTCLMELQRNVTLNYYNVLQAKWRKMRWK